MSTGEVVCVDEVIEMVPKLLVAFVVEALHGSFLDCSIHSLDLTVGPGMFRFGQSMIDIVLRARQFESVSTKELAFFEGFLDLWDRGAACARRGKVDAIVCKDRVDLVRHGGDEVAQEVGSRSSRGFLMQFDGSEFRGAVDCDEEMKFPLLGADLCDVDMKEADRIGLEFLL